MEKEKNDVANGQLTIFDIEQDAETENNNVPKKKYRQRTKCYVRCVYWCIRKGVRVKGREKGVIKWE